MAHGAGEGSTEFPDHHPDRLRDLLDPGLRHHRRTAVVAGVDTEPGVLHPRRRRGQQGRDLSLSVRAAVDQLAPPFTKHKKAGRWPAFFIATRDRYIHATHWASCFRSMPSNYKPGSSDGRQREIRGDILAAVRGPVHCHPHRSHGCDQSVSNGCALSGSFGSSSSFTRSSASSSADWHWRNSAMPRSNERSDSSKLNSLPSRRATSFSSSSSDCSKRAMDGASEVDSISFFAGSFMRAR